MNIPNKSKIGKLHLVSLTTRNILFSGKKQVFRQVDYQINKTDYGMDGGMYQTPTIVILN